MEFTNREIGKISLYSNGPVASGKTARIATENMERVFMQRLANARTHYGMGGIEEDDDTTLNRGSGLSM